MSIANPLTVSSIIQPIATQKLEETSKVKPLRPDFGVYAKDIVEISELGLEKQQKEIQIEASRSIEDIANEVIKVSSTIGKAKISGNLTNNQAANLYNKISALL